MKRFLFALALTLTLVFPGFAADLKWLTDLPQAKAQAKAEGKLVLLDFTGSDFCSSCIRLHKDVFSAKEFAAFAKERLVLMEVDFPLKKKQPAALKAANEALSKEFKVDGYPTLILLASDGKKLGEVEFDLFDASAKDIIAAIEKLAKKPTQ
ncbi:MAG: Thiol-disulfide isomerase or thioredoxin [Verrucomicrobiota bacterium]|jgi:thioredoxin-related protein